MKKRFILVMVIIILALPLLSACAKKKSPACNEDVTKEKALKEFFKKSLWTDEFKLLESGKLIIESGKKVQMKYSDSKLEMSDGEHRIVYYLENVRTLDINKDTGRYKCVADFNGEHYSEGGKETLLDRGSQIYYTSELTEDGKHYVTVSLLPL